MDRAALSALIERHGLISDQVDKPELLVTLVQLVGSLESPGSVVEFGCYAGTTSLYIRRVLDALRDPREFHVYDSFEGLPEKADEDLSPAGEQFKAGELSVSKKAFLLNFKKAGLSAPRVHKGWFDSLTAADIPASVSFAYLDGDYYHSILDPLRLLEPVLTPGALIVVDDYMSSELPGVRRAVDGWARPRGLGVSTEASLGILRFR